jgi:hypothetical protein
MILSDHFVFTPIELKVVYQTRWYAPGFLRARHRVVLACNDSPCNLDPKETVAIIDITFQRYFIAGLLHCYGCDYFFSVNFGNLMQVPVPACTGDNVWELLATHTPREALIVMDVPREKYVRMSTGSRNRLKMLGASKGAHSYYFSPLVNLL